MHFTIYRILPLIGTYMSERCIHIISYVEVIDSSWSMLFSIDDANVISMVFKAFVQVVVQRLILSRDIATLIQSLRISLHFRSVLVVIQINQTPLLLLLLGMSQLFEKMLFKVLTFLLLLLNFGLTFVLITIIDCWG